MGRPKLLLEFDGESLIRRVVTALGEGGADRIIVVPPVGSPEAAEIAAEASGAGAEVLVPECQPAEMRDSVELGLAVLDADPRPSSVLVTPADVPGITPALVARLLDVARENPERIIIPTHDGHRGHPVLFPWTIAVRIRDLPDEVGVNRLVEMNRDRIVEIPVPVVDAIDDLDTPEDLGRWHSAHAPSLDRSNDDAKMTVRVRLFALAKERAGRSEVEVALVAPARVGDLREALRGRIPQIDAICAGAMISVDETYASDETPITSASRVALIPPVSGGGATAYRLEISSRDD
jgi:CTP:molybdopterin cytidylyltransferase MocA/molybdopterin converting factor small subunit